jgi:hypothetical protein
MAEYKRLDNPKSVSEAVVGVDDVIKNFIDQYEGEADTEDAEYVAKCWHIVKNNLR